jgi:hypothetical protein
MLTRRFNSPNRIGDLGSISNIDGSTLLPESTVGGGTDDTLEGDLEATLEGATLDDDSEINFLRRNTFWNFALGLLWKIWGLVFAVLEGMGHFGGVRRTI